MKLARGREQLSPIKAVFTEVKQEQLSPIKAVFTEVKQEQLSPIKAVFTEAVFTEVKQEQLSPMKVGKGPEVDITYEKIIEDEYGKILVKQELLSLAEQGQHLADSGKSKEEDRKMIVCLVAKYKQQTKEEVLVNPATIVAGKSCFNIEQAVNYANVFDRLFKEIKKMQGDFSRIRERFPYYFLNYFLNHETDGFLDRMRECSGCLPQCDYQRLLSNIAAKGHKQLFIEFLNFGKGEGLQRINRVKEDILPFLFQLEDEDIEKILDDFTPEEKKIIISYIKDNIYH
ncbi:hypothetical protein TNIN_36881 [Trichonephila inaurata madagascariensis]|uniref:Uncharacterized protein n=1 Tax=Trichonephila inaurata madagascariensis TaxID=2747483 RepID=A0A8X6Y352_9ARAC|nr:hypothetical protein TNIN_36881 [Trichonephila inaurata madagascariensis]